MASGTNSTFRQVGLATSVAAMGSIFAGRVAGGTEAAFVSGLDEILLITAILAATAGVLAMALIRQKDFVVHARAAAGGARSRRRAGGRPRARAGGGP